MNNKDLTEYNRLLWHCRRGMLELDLLLIPFCKQHYKTLTVDQQALFRQLIDCEDVELYDWLMQRSTHNNPNMSALIKQIIGS